MEVFIKNMVCNRCVMVVKQIFTSEGAAIKDVTLGRVELANEPSADQMERIEQKLEGVGFEILTSQKKKTIEKIKTTISETLQGDLSGLNLNFSEILSSALHKEYSYLSKLFSEAEGITIEKYIIDQKIERVKELLAYGDDNVNEIAFEMGYSSVAHLSAQFKKVTGFTPSEFRKLKSHVQGP
jgi:AraC family transcriptional regulator